MTIQEFTHSWLQNHSPHLLVLSRSSAQWGTQSKQVCSQASLFPNFHLIHLPNQIKLLCKIFFSRREPKDLSKSHSKATNITDRMLQQQVQPGHMAHGKKFLKVKYSKPTVWLWCAGNLHKAAQAYKILFSYFRRAACVVPQTQYFALLCFLMSLSTVRRSSNIIYSGPTFLLKSAVCLQACTFRVCTLYY